MRSRSPARARTPRRTRPAAGLSRARAYRLACAHAMTLHLVYEKAHTASTRIRLTQMAPHLEARGFACRLLAYPRDDRARGELRDSLAPGDAVIIYRTQPTASETRYWRALPAPRIYDFDDAVMLGRHLG